MGKITSGESPVVNCSYVRNFGNQTHDFELTFADGTMASSSTTFEFVDDTDKAVVEAALLINFTQGLTSFMMENIYKTPQLELDLSGI